LVFDQECILWSETCEGKGACLEYNTERLPFIFFGVCLGIKGLSYICIAFTYISARYAVVSSKEKEHQVSKASGLDNDAFDHMHENSELESNVTRETDVSISTICNTTEFTHL